MPNRHSDRAYRYGDFPHLFWDAQPNAPLDVTSAVTLARLLRRGDPETIAALVPPELLRESLETLFLPEHTKSLWRRVLARLPESAAASAPSETA
jgi:hypothetical protein